MGNSGLKLNNSAKEEIIEVLTSLMTKVINQGYIPEQWITAKLVPLLEKGKAEDINN